MGKQQFSSQLLSNSRYMTGLFSCHKTDEKFQEFIWFWGCCLKVRDICMHFELYFKVHNLVSVHPKGIAPGQMTNLNMIFRVVSVYQLVKI